MKPDASTESDFDPYYKWLGIARKDQPADHYRLLGLARFESDREVIRVAAERQTAYVQTFKIGPQSSISQRVLNEIAQAKLCLLNPDRKADYDRALRPPAAVERVASPRPDDAVDGAATGESLDFEEFSRPARPVGGPKLRRPGAKRSAWGPTLLVCLCGVGLLVVLLAKFKPAEEMAKPAAVPIVQPPAQPAAAGPIRPKRPSPDRKPPVRNPPIVTNPVPPGKLPVPTAEQIAQAQDHMQIVGVPSSEQLYQAAVDSADPTMRFVMFRMSMDAAVKENEPILAQRALDYLVDHYEVDAAQLSGELDRALSAIAKAEPPATNPVPAHPSSTEKAAPTLNDRIKIVTLAEIKQAFPESMTAEPTLFVLYDKNVREGLMAFDQSGSLAGPTLIVHSNGMPSVFCQYVPGRRDSTRNGALCSWSEKGDLEYYSECQKGVKLGLTCLLENGRPVYVEEWSGRLKKVAYLVEHDSGGEQRIKLADVNAAQRPRLQKVQDRMDELEKELGRAEKNWKGAFADWFKATYQGFLELNVSIANAPNKKTADSLTTTRNQLQTQLKESSRDGRRAILDAIKF